MKAFLPLLVAAISLAATASLLAQGSLTPPGAPAPTMKTLEQIEPRVPLVAGSPGVAIDAAGTITISQRGSYFLTRNLQVTGGHGIDISATDVAIDLRGFTLSTSALVGGSTIGIALPGPGFVLVGTPFITNVSVTNGTIIGFDNGIAPRLVSNPPVRATLGQVRVSDVFVRQPGNAGIWFTGKQGTVERCHVQNTGGTGIIAQTVLACTATDCAGTAIIAGTVRDCTANATGTNAAGIAADVVSGSKGTSAQSHGIQADRVSNCFGEATGGTGFGIGSRSVISTGFGSAVVENSTGKSAGSNGISAGIVNNCIGTGEATGIFAEAVSGSFGESGGSGRGIHAVTVDNCSARAQSGIALSAETASNSKGSSATGRGIEAQNATNCYGSTQGTSVNAYGIDCGTNGTASYCRGSGNIAIRARNAIACTAGSGAISAPEKHLGTP